MTKKKTKKQVPDFDKMSYEEEALWWETHDTSDYQDEFEATDIQFKLAPAAKIDAKTKRLYERLVSENLEKTIAVRFTHRDYENLKKEAKNSDLKMATLIRRWALEKLRSNKRQPQTLS